MCIFPNFIYFDQKFCIEFSDKHIIEIDLINTIRYADFVS